VAVLSEDRVVRESLSEEELGRLLDPGAYLGLAGEAADAVGPLTRLS
jgi:hypothetical protein